MAHELTHDEASEFLGVYALDALDDDERELVERHLDGCGLCRAEVLEHVEVAGLLSTGVFGAPPSVWDRISEELQGTAPPLDMAPIHARRPPPAAEPPTAAGSAAPTESPAASGPVSLGASGSGEPARPPGDELGERRARRSAGRRGAGVRIGALVAAASVAAGVIGVLGVRVVDDGRQGNDIAIGSHRDELRRTIDAAKADPEVVKVEMRSPDGALVADAWVLPDGRGYLAEDNLPGLTPDRNYQLWAVVGGDRISVGLLGPDPDLSAFVADGPVVALAITDEVAGGVVSTSRQPLVVGPVRKS